MFIGDFEPIFGKNVRYLRSLCRMSQETLALLIGTTRYNIQKIERAKGLITMDYRIFYRLCRIFFVPPEIIFRRDLQEQGYMLTTFTEFDKEEVREYFLEDE